jgi:hypothetical protein
MKTRKTARKQVRKNTGTKKRLKPISELVKHGEFEAEEKLAENYFMPDEETQPRKSKGADEEL